MYITQRLTLILLATPVMLFGPTIKRNILKHYEEAWFDRKNCKLKMRLQVQGGKDKKDGYDLIVIYLKSVFIPTFESYTRTCIL